jgi:hypothetical protein
MKQQKGISTILSIIIALLVIAGGVVTYNYYSTPEEELSAGESPGGIQDETADWKTYSNSTMGFSIKYPLDWEKSEQLLGTATRVQFLIPNEAITWVRVGVYYNQTKGRETTLDELISGMKKSYEILKEEEMFLDNVPAKKLFLLWSESKPGYLIFLHKEGEKNIIEIGLEIQNPQKQDEYSLIFNQMLSTFRFIDKEGLVDYLPENYSFDKQQVGKPTDGQGLNLIRHADHGNYYRFVFDITDQYGSEEDYIVVPSTEAFYAHSAKTIGLIINGIRRDLTDYQIGKPIMVDHEVVASYVRDKV